MPARSMTSVGLVALNPPTARAVMSRPGYGGWAPSPGQSRTSGGILSVDNGVRVRQPASLREAVRQEAKAIGAHLEKAFQLNMDMLLRMQAWFDAMEMHKQAGKIKISPYVSA
jgi:hypothetical protein